MHKINVSFLTQSKIERTSTRWRRREKGGGGGGGEEKKNYWKVGKTKKYAVFATTNKSDWQLLTWHIWIHQQNVYYANIKIKLTLPTYTPSSRYYLPSPFFLISSPPPPPPPLSLSLFLSLSLSHSLSFSPFSLSFYLPLSLILSFFSLYLSTGIYLAVYTLLYWILWYQALLTQVHVIVTPS